MRGEKVAKGEVKVVAYADDVAAIAESAAQLQENLERMATALATEGLQFQQRKRNG